MKRTRIGFSNKDKKANIVLDSLLIIVVLFALSVIGFTAQLIMSQTNSAIQANSVIGTEGKASIAVNAAQSSSVFDGMYVTSFILLWGLLLVGSYNIKTAPVLFVFFLILFAVVIFVGITLANASDSIANDSLFSTYAQQMPKTLFIINNMNLVLVFVIASVALVLWGKNVFDKSPY